MYNIFLLTTTKVYTNVFNEIRIYLTKGCRLLLVLIYLRFIFA
jgi:hypothetical protein